MSKVRSLWERDRVISITRMVNCENRRRRVMGANLSPAAEYAREQIREAGHMSAVELTAVLTIRAAELGSLEGWVGPSEQFFDSLCPGGIHRVEYTNGQVEGYRMKDLFYYNPYTPYCKCESGVEPEIYRR